MRARRKVTDFGRLVKKALLDRNMTQHDLSLLLGVKDSYLSDVLKGEKKGEKYLDRIHILLDLSKAKKVS